MSHCWDQLHFDHSWTAFHACWIHTVFSLLHARASNFSAWATYPAFNRNRRWIGTSVYSWAIYIYWSLLPCEAFVLYSAIGNVVVHSSPATHATRNFPESVGVTDPVRILRRITLKCFTAASFQVFAATATARAWYWRWSLSSSLLFQVTGICHVDIVPRPGV